MKCLIKLRKDYKIIKNLNNDILLLNRRLHLRGDRRVVLSVENSTPSYSNFLCFTVSVQTNKLISRRGVIGYSDIQKENYDLIKSLYDMSIEYKKIAHYLNKKKIKTVKGKVWRGNHVHAVLKRYKERLKRLEFINKEYETVWNRMKIKY